jgi:ABC-type amino acid transport system permease subunit
LNPALLRMIAPLGNEFIVLIDNSALVSLLTIPDLTAPQCGAIRGAAASSTLQR